MAHVGFVGLGLHPHFFDRFDRRHDGRPVDEVGHRHAFDEVAVAAPRSAAERQVRGVGLILEADKLRIARLDDARRGDRRIEGVAAEDRQVLQRCLVERCGDRGAAALDQRRLAGDGDLLRQLADREREVLHQGLLGADAQTRCVPPA